MLDTELVTEPHTGPEQLKFEPDYQAKSLELSSALTGYQQSESMQPTEYKIGFGPTYHARSSGGIDCTVRVVFLKDTHNVLRFSLIALDPSGTEIGHNISSIEVENGRQTVMGGVYTGVRGKGISTVIESAYVDFLQRLVNQQGTPITWEVINDNYAQLQLLKDLYLQTPTEKLRLAIVEKEAEQERWRAQFAFNGKLGVAPDGKRTFSPPRSLLAALGKKENVETVDSIALSRNSQGLYQPSEVRRINSKNQKEVREAHLGFLYRMTGLGTPH
ncbi:MAG: hypothetical protein WC775_00150 [Patescibacteria group bacterium]|jgi:hypothetical protein